MVKDGQIKAHDRLGYQITKTWSYEHLKIGIKGLAFISAWSHSKHKMSIPWLLQVTVIQGEDPKCRQHMGGR